MYCQIFKLDKYFKETQIYYYFFDCLFTFEEEGKEKILERLGIIPSSYRTQRSKAKTTKTTINILLEYFNCGAVIEKEHLEYEKLLSKIYYNCYFRKTDKLEKQLEIINNKLETYTILKPLLILFRILIQSTLDPKYREIKSELYNDLKYIQSFYNKKYFKDDLEFLCLIFLYFYDIVDGKSVINKLDNLSIAYPNLAWLRYYLQASKAYTKGDDVNALINYEYVLNEFRRTNNLDRYFYVVANVAGLYNILGHYHLSYNVTSQVIEYVFSDIKDERRAQNILMHYLFSNVMLGRYEEIINFFTMTVYNRECINPISASMCLIVADKVGKLEEFYDLLSYETENKNFNIILSYIKTKDRKILNNLSNVPYYIKIKEIL